MIFAVSDAVLTAYIGAGATVLVALVGWLSTRPANRKAKEVSQKIGEPNGQGNLMNVLNQQSAALTQVQTTLNQVVGGQLGLVEKVATHDKDIAELKAGQITQDAHNVVLSDVTGKQGVSLFDLENRTDGLEKRVEKLEAKGGTEWVG